MSEELELFVKCPECGGHGKTYDKYTDEYSPCERCEVKGVIPWEPKAAPLVWTEGEDEDPKAFISREPNIFYTCYETVGVGFRAVLVMRGECVWGEAGFKDEASAKAACQAHADGLVKQLLTENKQ